MYSGSQGRSKKHSKTPSSSPISALFRFVCSSSLFFTRIHFIDIPADHRPAPCPPPCRFRKQRKARYSLLGCSTTVRRRRLGAACIRRVRSHRCSREDQPSSGDQNQDKENA